MKSRSLPVLLAASLLFGAGCSKPVPAPTPAKQQPSSNPSVILFPPSGAPELSVNQELQKILENFRDLKSFRTKYSMATPQGQVAGQFDFIKPDRFKGQMTLGTAGTTDIVIIGESIYIRANNGNWVNYSKAPSAKTISDALKKGMGGSSNLEALGVNDNAIVKKTRDEERKCDLFKATVKNAEGAVVSLELCADNKLPKYVQISTPQGPVNIEYYDYNSLFLIEKPI
jgi:hypothetical protein